MTAFNDKSVPFDLPEASDDFLDDSLDDFLGGFLGDSLSASLGDPLGDDALNDVHVGSDAVDLQLEYNKNFNCVEFNDLDACNIIWSTSNNSYGLNSLRLTIEFQNKDGQSCGFEVYNNRYRASINNLVLEEGSFEQRSSLILSDVSFIFHIKESYTNKGQCSHLKYVEILAGSKTLKLLVTDYLEQAQLKTFHHNRKRYVKRYFGQKLEFFHHTQARTFYDDTPLKESVDLTGKTPTSHTDVKFKQHHNFNDTEITLFFDDYFDTHLCARFSPQNAYSFEISVNYRNPSSDSREIVHINYKCLTAQSFESAVAKTEYALQARPTTFRLLSGIEVMLYPQLNSDNTLCINQLQILYKKKVFQLYKNEDYCHPCVLTPENAADIIAIKNKSMRIFVTPNILLEANADNNLLPLADDTHTQTNSVSDIALISYEEYAFINEMTIEGERMLSAQMATPKAGNNIESIHSTHKFISVLDRLYTLEGELSLVNRKYLAPRCNFGTVSINHDDSLLYIPNKDFTGVDHIHYAITDRKGGIETASLTITIDKITNASIINYSKSHVMADEKITNINLVELSKHDDTSQLVNDIDNRPIAFNGDVIVNDIGHIDYTPFKDFCGTDLIMFKVRTVEGVIQDASLIVNVAQDNIDSSLDISLKDVFEASNKTSRLSQSLLSKTKMAIVDNVATNNVKSTKSSNDAPKNEANLLNDIDIDDDFVISDDGVFSADGERVALGDTLTQDDIINDIPVLCSVIGDNAMTQNEEAQRTANKKSGIIVTSSMNTYNTKKSKSVIADLADAADQDQSQNYKYAIDNSYYTTH